jgi:hypothetical protein
MNKERKKREKNRENKLQKFRKKMSKGLPKKNLQDSLPEEGFINNFP